MWEIFWPFLGSASHIGDMKERCAWMRSNAGPQDFSEEISKRHYPIVAFFCDSAKTSHGAPYDTGDRRFWANNTAWLIVVERNPEIGRKVRKGWKKKRTKHYHKADAIPTFWKASTHEMSLQMRYKWETWPHTCVFPQLFYMPMMPQNTFYYFYV